MKMRAERGLVHVLIEARAIDDDGEGNSLTPVVSSSHCPLPPPLKLHIKRKSAALEPLTPTLTPPSNCSTPSTHPASNLFITSASSSAGSGKRMRQTPTVAAIAQVAETIADIGTVIGNSSRAGGESSPVQKWKAMDLAQELEDYLNDNDLSSLLELFETNVMAADAYVTIKQEGLQKTWVQRKLVKIY